MLQAFVTKAVLYSEYIHLKNIENLLVQDIASVSYPFPRKSDVFSFARFSCNLLFIGNVSSYILDLVVLLRVRIKNLGKTVKQYRDMQPFGEQ